MTESLLRLTYSAHNPTDVSSATSPFALEGQGHLRIWTLDAATARGKAPVWNGGDYVEPGTYGYEEIFGESDEVTLYVEAVRESTAMADLTIQLEWDLFGNGQFISADQVRVTAVRVEVIAKNADGSTFRTNRLNLSHLDEAPDGPITRSAFQTYWVNVYDPRQTGISTISIGGQTLDLEPTTGGFYQTPEFVVVHPATTVNWATAYPRIELSSESLELSYNPIWPFRKGETNKSGEDFNKVAREMYDEITDMESTGWTGTSDGSFGNEVHRRVGEKFDNQPGWLVNVYVRNGTNEILSIGMGNTPPGGVTGTTQIDLMKVSDTYNPAVGQVLDPNEVTNLFDIKTSINQTMDANQLQRLRNAIDGRDIVMALPHRRWSPVSGWGAVKKRALAFKALGLVGAASAAYSLLHYSEYNAELDAMAAHAELILQRDRFPGGRYHQNGIEGQSLKITDLGKLNTMMCNYLRHFVPEDTIIDVIEGGMLYIIVKDALEPSS